MNTNVESKDILEHKIRIMKATSVFFFVVFVSFHEQQQHSQLLVSTSRLVLAYI